MTTSDNKEKAAEPMEVDGTETKDGDDKTKTTPKSLDAITVENIRDQCRVLERSEAAKEPRQVLRVLRNLLGTRRTLNANVLLECIQELLPVTGTKHATLTTRASLLRHVKGAGAAKVEAMDVDTLSTGSSALQPHRSPRMPRSPRTPGMASASSSATAVKSSFSKSAAIPEIETYIHLLVVLWLIDQKRVDEATESLTSLVSRVEQHNRRSMDALAAKVYYYYSLMNESKPRDTLTFILGRLRMASLRGDCETQATLINCVLGIYLRNAWYKEADKFFTKVTFPEMANNNEWARYVFYTGRIKAILFEYAASHQYLAQAIRKAPQREGTGVGFKQMAHKYHIVVTLLLGEIPERGTFRIPSLKHTLVPYLRLTHAVRTGNYAKYLDVMRRHSKYFETDGTISLAARLKKNVVLTALKQISMVYSRIRLVDIVRKLELQSVDDVQCIVGNAIRDGVIDATIELDGEYKGAADGAWYMRTNEPVDVYRTSEPQQQFDNRIKFCLQLHNVVTKALRYPADNKDKSVETSEEQRERELQELELAKELAEDDDDDY